MGKTIAAKQKEGRQRKRSSHRVCKRERENKCSTHEEYEENAKRSKQKETNEKWNFNKISRP